MTRGIAKEREREREPVDGGQGQRRVVCCAREWNASDVRCTFILNDVQTYDCRRTCKTAHHKKKKIVVVVAAAAAAAASFFPFFLLERFPVPTFSQ
jgi:hypothetical protein